MLLRDHHHVTSGREASSANCCERVRSMQPAVREGRKGDLPERFAFLYAELHPL